MKVKLIILSITDNNCSKIANRLYDFTEFCVQGCYPAHCVKDTDNIKIMDEDYIFVIKAGHLFWNRSIFDQCIEEKIKHYPEEAVVGDHNWFLIDCEKVSNNFNINNYTEIKQFSKSINDLKTYSFPSDNYEYIESFMEDIEWFVNEEVPESLYPFAKDLYDATLNLKFGYYVINTEGISYLENYNNTFDNYMGVCGGLKTYVILGQDYFTEDTNVLMFDISPAAIEWQKFLREHWDGTKNKFNDLRINFKKENQEYVPIEDQHRTYDRYLIENNLTEDRIKNSWIKFQKMNVEYARLDLFNKNDVEFLINKTRNKNNTYFWLSNCFKMERIVFQYGSTIILEEKFMKNFRNKSSSTCVFDVGNYINV